MFRSLKTFLDSLTSRRATPEAHVPAPPDATYRAFTKEFDAVVSGVELAARFIESVKAMPGMVNDYATVDLDALERKRAKLRANCETLRARLMSNYSTEQRNDTVVALLFDHSGSLRGEPMLIVAELAEALADTLTGVNVATEVLGFTTSRWRGGRSYEKWRAEDSPSFPGRLNDLLHVIHLDGAQGPRVGPHRFPILRYPNVFKENVDGEALEWAHARATANNRRHKVLIVISDGAPVDDATITHNWSMILHDHLLHVIATITAEGNVTLGGLGIEHDVHKFYPNSAAARPASQLTEVGPRFIEQMIALSHAVPTTPTPAAF